MQKQKVFISVIVFNQNYVDAFLEYPFLTLKNNIEKISNYNVTIFVETQEEHYSQFKKYFDKINHKNLKIIFKSDFVEDKDLFSYSFLTTIQIEHILTAKNENYDFIFFTYGDMVYNNDCFKNSLIELTKSNKLSVLSFALLIKKNNQLDKFMEKMLNNNNHLNFLIKNKEMINPFHKLFSSSSFSYNKSFIFEFTNNNLFLKALHTHPVCLRINNKIKREKLINATNKVLSLDNGFVEFLSSEESDYIIEEDLNKISIFTYDNFKKERFFVNFDKFFDNDKEIIQAGNYIFFNYFFKRSSNIKKHLFKNFTIKYSEENNSAIEEYSDLEKETFKKNFEIFMDYIKKTVKDNKFFFILKVLHPVYMAIIFALVIMSKIPLLEKQKQKYQEYYLSKFKKYFTSTKKKDFLYHTSRRLFLLNPKEFILYVYSKY